jgi:hypothetical protein
VAVFFDHVGKSETNRQGTDLTQTANGAWCQGASSAAVVKSLQRNGLKFRPRPSTQDLSEWGGPKRGQMTYDQAQLYGMWVNEDNAKARTEKALQEGDAQKSATGSALAPGDVISIVTSTSPPSGHVATVVEFNDPVIRMVSGNAGSSTLGDGSIRVEEIIRQKAPAGFAWDQTHHKSEDRKPGINCPAEPGVAYVVSVQRASKLDAKALAKATDEELQALHLVRM